MISVIIPLYNKANCIKRTIQSVLSQSYKDFELLIVDDGSTDESKNIVLSITDSRIRYIYKENGGVSSARNFGAQKANSKWLFFSLGVFDEQVSYNEDYGFLLKMLSTYEIFIVKDLIMVYTDDNKSLSTRRTPLESGFGNYMFSLSIENIYRRVLIYQQYIFTYKRRLAIGDIDGAIKVKNELNLRFSLLMKYTTWIMVKFSSLYNKIKNL